MTSFEAFYYGISIQESGGNYKAVGPQLSSGRAYGKYQIMGFNIGPWSQKYLGYRITPQQFLNNPAAQEKIAKGKLREYYNAYGARGAASAWYSGNPKLHMSTAPQGAAGPSIKSYVDGVLRHATKYKGGSGGSSSSGNFGSPGSSSSVNSSKGGGASQSMIDAAKSPSSIGPNAVTSGDTTTWSASPELDREDLLARFGMTEKVLREIPSVGALVEKAITKGYSADRFQAELQNTSFWKNHSKAWREAKMKSLIDPSTYKEERDKARAHVKAVAAEYGITSSGWINQGAAMVYWNDYSDEQLRQWFGANVGPIKDGQFFGGKMGAWQDQLTKTGYANGVKIDAKFLNQWVRAIAAGGKTIEQAENAIRKQSSSLFGAFKKQIMGGEDMMDLAQPYIKSMGNLLELPDGQLDLFDGTIRKGLSYKTKDATTPMALWQFEDLVRKDKRWVKTTNAREAFVQAGHQVAQNFGVMF